MLCIVDCLCADSERFTECTLICPEKTSKFASVNVIITAGEQHNVAPGAKVALAFYQMGIKH